MRPTMYEVESQNQHVAMVAELAKPGKQIAEHVTPERLELLHMAVGIAGEAGEVLELFTTKSIATLEDEDRPALIKELGDLEFYTEGLRQVLGLRRDINGYTIGNNDRYDTALMVASKLSVAAGAILEITKKVFFNGRDIDVTKYVRAFTELEYQQQRARDLVDASLQEVLEDNTRKLRDRFGHAYSDEKAAARADEKAPA